MLRVRSRFPVRWPLVRVALVLSIVLPALLTLAWSQSGASSLGEQYAVGSTILLVAAAVITGFRYVQHQMPNTTMLLPGFTPSAMATEPAPVWMPHPSGPSSSSGSDGSTFTTLRSVAIACDAKLD